MNKLICGIPDAVLPVLFSRDAQGGYQQSGKDDIGYHGKVGAADIPLIAFILKKIAEKIDDTLNAGKHRMPIFGIRFLNNGQHEDAENRHLTVIEIKRRVQKTIDSGSEIRER
ncbi:MAG TPA: hypothetical protein PKY19_03945 [Oscillospiraceae bacterium]|nr:hypothetical protein [Oscillospiraceae bacterium]